MMGTNLKGFREQTEIIVAFQSMVLLKLNRLGHIEWDMVGVGRGY